MKKLVFMPKEGNEEQLERIISKFKSISDKNLDVLEKHLDNAIDEIKKDDKSKYMPTPYPIKTYSKTKSNKIDNVEVAITKETTNEPFIQYSPIANYRIFRDMRNFNAIGKKKEVGSDSAIKLFMYIVSIIKQDCNYVYLNKDKVMRYTGIGKNGYYPTIRILNKLNIIVKVKNVEDCYIINHNMIYNGDKKLLSKWIYSSKYHILEFKKDNNKNETYVELDAEYLKVNQKRFKNIIFEPFEEAKIE